MANLTIVKSDDWEGLYYNGDLRLEGHSIPVDEALEFVSGLPPYDFQTLWVDENWISSIGSLPNRIEDVKKL